MFLFYLFFYFFLVATWYFFPKGLEIKQDVVSGNGYGEGSQVLHVKVSARHTALNR